MPGSLIARRRGTLAAVCLAVVIGVAGCTSNNGTDGSTSAIAPSSAPGSSTGSVTGSAAPSSGADSRTAKPSGSAAPTAGSAEASARAEALKVPMGEQKAGAKVPMRVTLNNGATFELEATLDKVIAPPKKK